MHWKNNDCFAFFTRKYVLIPIFLQPNAKLRPLIFQTMKSVRSNFKYQRFCTIGFLRYRRLENLSLWEKLSSSWLNCFLFKFLILLSSIYNILFQLLNVQFPWTRPMDELCTIQYPIILWYPMNAIMDIWS